MLVGAEHSMPEDWGQETEDRGLLLLLRAQRGNLILSVIAKPRQRLWHPRITITNDFLHALLHWCE